MTLRFSFLAAAACTLIVATPMTAVAQTLSTGPAVAEAVAAHEQSAAPAPAFSYSDGYRTRAKIHKIGSLTMVPLLATQGFLGKSLYDSPTQQKRDWHRRVAWGVGGLFAANTITGTMNLIEGRKDPNGRKLRMAHGLLMLAADAGFLATAVMRPDARDGSTSFADQRSHHRAVAFTSVGLATTSYLLMLFGRK